MKEKRGKGLAGKNWAKILFQVHLSSVKWKLFGNDLQQGELPHGNDLHQRKQCLLPSYWMQGLLLLHCHLVGKSAVEKSDALTARALQGRLSKPSPGIESRNATAHKCHCLIDLSGCSAIPRRPTVLI